MVEQSALTILRGIGAIITDSHIIHKTGRHGRTYINKYAILPHTEETSQLCFDIAERFRSDGVDIVIAPAISSIIISQLVAHYLTITTGREVLGIYAEKETSFFHNPKEKGRSYYYNTGKSVIRPDFSKFVPGKNVLVAKDVVTTGRSIKSVVKSTRNIGGTVIGVGGLCNRSSVVAVDFGNVPKFEFLLTIDMETVSEEECRRFGPCSKGVPIYKDFREGHLSLV